MHEPIDFLRDVNRLRDLHCRHHDLVAEIQRRVCLSKVFAFLFGRQVDVAINEIFEPLLLDFARRTRLFDVLHVCGKLADCQVNFFGKRRRLFCSMFIAREGLGQPRHFVGSAFFGKRRENILGVVGKLGAVDKNDTRRNFSAHRRELPTPRAQRRFYFAAERK